MRFVNNEAAVFRQYPSSGQIRQQQGMVDHDQMSSFRLLPGPIEKTAIRIVRTTLQHTVLLRGGDPVPQGRLVPRDAEFSTVATGGGIDPEQQSQEEPGLFPGQSGGLAPRVPSPEAEVVAPALKLGYAQVSIDMSAPRFIQRPEQVGDVLVHQLFLEVDGIGGHHHRPVVLQSVGHSRQQIGNGLPDAGPGFDNGVLTVVQSIGYLLHHGYLARAVLKPREGARQRASLAQERIQTGDVQGPGDSPWSQRLPLRHLKPLRHEVQLPGLPVPERGLAHFASLQVQEHRAPYPVAARSQPIDLRDQRQFQA